jgi:glucosamine 6-phosphate synthetase-like amidotransferase/phosphosugar isomerase protein
MVASVCEGAEKFIQKPASRTGWDHTRWATRTDVKAADVLVNYNYKKE